MFGESILCIMARTILHASMVLEHLRTWLQSLQRMWATQQAYSSGMGVLATSSSTLRQIAARSA